MLSNLASYIFGGGDDEGQPRQPPSSSVLAPPPPPPPPPPKVEDSDGDVEDEEWVVVANGGRPRNINNPQLTLGSLNEVVPRPTVSGSTGSSASPSEDGEMEEDAAGEAEQVK